MFSEKEAKHLFKLLQNHKGGAIGVSPGEASTLDILINDVLAYVSMITPASVLDTTNNIASYALVLSWLERSTALGPLVGISLDAATSALPVIAAAIQNITPSIVGLAPIPYAGTVGSIIGSIIAAGFIFLLTAIETSRGSFGKAFLDMFLVIPFVGTTIYNAASKADAFVKKTLSRRAKLIASVYRIFGDDIGGIVDGLTPDFLEPVGQPDPSGGKRFSTTRRNLSKWPKTRRNRYV